MFFLCLTHAKTICRKGLSQRTIQRTSASSSCILVSLVPFSKVLETV